MKPYPKKMRIVDKELIEEVRSYGKCMLEGKGECWGGLDVHHIWGKGAGGDDTKNNLILLCRNHHALAHMHKITKLQLHETLAKLYNPWYNRNMIVRNK